MTRNIFTVLFMYALIGCSDSSEETESVTSAESRDPINCIEPENPYNDDGGHDAGYKWAEEHGELCDGNSDSFNEGCEEYHDQLRRYEKCLAQSRN